MARDFTNAPPTVNTYLEYAGAVLTGYPATLACWFRPDDVATSQDLLHIGTTSANTYLRLNFGGATAGDPVRGVAADAGTTGVAVSSAGAAGVAGVWYHACATFADATNRAAYFNGGSKGTNATSVAAPVGMDRTNVAVGMYSGTTRTNPFDGQIAECGVWSAALSDAEVASLAAGVSPLLVRPGSLVAYWRLIDDQATEIDLLGAGALTATGTAAKTSHPRVFYPARRRFRYGVTAAATAFAQYWYRQHVAGGMTGASS